MQVILVPEVFLDFSSFREAASTSREAASEKNLDVSLSPVSRRFVTRVFTASRLSRSSLVRRKSRKTSGTWVNAGLI